MKDHITILATSDVHGFIYPYDYATLDTKNIGYAKINSLINSLRDENTILIDNGDVLEGSPLMFYHTHYKIDEVAPISKVIKAMNYDFINIGNHDYNYGEEVLLRHLSDTDTKCITSNILYKGKPFGNYQIKEVANKRLAFFGLTTQYIPHWENKEHILNSTFLDAYDTAKSIVKEIKDKEKVDYIVCVYHGGFERDIETGELIENDTNEDEGYKILKDIDGIDILISGHQHRFLYGTKFNKVYTQTESNGKNLACIDIDLNTNEIKPSLLMPELDADKAILDIVKDEEEACQKWLDEPLGNSNVDLIVKDEDEARLNKSQVITFINLVSKYYSNADLCASALFQNATGFKKEITMRDLVSTYTFPNTLVVKKINGEILKEYLEKNAEFFDIKDGKIVVNEKYIYPKLQKFNYDMVDGIEYTIKVSNKIGNRITSLTYKDNSIKDDDEFLLCVNNYRASGGGDFNMIASAPVIKEIQTSMVELLADYILAKKVIDFKPINNIKVEL